MALAIILIVFAAIRVRLLSVPFERDEGEYAYAGQLILHGVPPYKLAYNMKLPGIYYAYALIMAVFGQSVMGVHLGLLLCNSASILVIFLIGKKLFGSVGGLATAASFGMLTINSWVFGPQAHATHFVVLPALVGILYAMKSRESRDLKFVAASGLALGIAFTMKQQGVFLVLFGVLCVIADRWRERPFAWKHSAVRVAVFTCAAAVPIIAICLTLSASGVFDKFWFWAVSYASQYVTESTPEMGWRVFTANTWSVVRSVYPLSILAVAGLALVWVDRKSRGRAIFVTTFFIFAFLTICPGLYFRPHYYVTWMPGVALAIGAAVSAGSNLLRRASYVPGLIFLILLIVTVSTQREFLFLAPVDKSSWMMYGGAPWREMQAIANYVRNQTKPSDTIAVLGSEPEVYFFAGRKSATGYIYTYPLLERQKFAHRMQMEMIREIEAARPKYIVYAQSWGTNFNSDRTILRWAPKYCFDNYYLDGIVQTNCSSVTDWETYHTDYVWGEKSSSYKYDPNRCIYVFVRK